MYKIKIMNFKPYEYEVLDKQLKKLGDDGYYTDDLSLISIFKKKNHPVYYKIDFLNTKGLKRTEKRKQKEKFYDPYLDIDYQPIYNKRGMYVFVGNQEASHTMNINKMNDFIDSQTIFQYIWNIIGTFLLCVGFAYYTFNYSTIDTFLSYGITFAYIGVFVFLLTCLYRNIVNTLGMLNFKNRIQKQQKEFSISLTKNLRLIYLLLSLCFILLITGGLAEDYTNIQPFSIQEHPMLILKDLNVNTLYESSSKKQSSFTVPESYQYLEISDKNIIFTKEYYLSSIKKANQLFEDLKNNPHQYVCTDVKTKDNIIYGYYGDKLNTLIIKKDNMVANISFELSLTQEQINTIVNFY